MHTGKIIYLTLIVICAFALICFIRGDKDFHISRVLPCASGQPLSLYDFAGMILIAMTIAGIARLRQAEGTRGSTWSETPVSASHGRFRLWIIVLPATVFVAAWLIRGMRASVSWPEIARAAGAEDIDAYGRLTILAMLLIVATLAFKCVNSK